MERKKQQYHWMREDQRELFLGLKKSFGLKNLTEFGNFLGLKHPYHGAKLIFETKNLNKHLVILLREKQADDARINNIESVIKETELFKSHIDDALKHISTSFSLISNVGKKS
jgi:hypothetical protein